MRTLAMVCESARTGAGTAWWFLDTLVVEHRNASGSGPVVLEVTLPVGAAPPVQVHRDLDDSWYVLDGQMVVKCDDQLALARAGHWVSVPRGRPHTFRVIGWRAARVLIVHGNSGFADLVREIGRPAEAIELPAPADGPGPEALGRAMEAHDATTIGPPMTEEEAQRFLSTVRG